MQGSNELESSKKKPSGSRPISRRFVSADSQRSQSNISSPGSINTSSSVGERTLGRHSRVTSRSSTLRLVQPESGARDEGEGWLMTEQVLSPDSEHEPYPYLPNPKSRSTMSPPPSMPKQGHRRPFPVVTHPRANTIDLSERTALPPPSTRETLPFASQPLFSERRTVSSPTEDVFSVRKGVTSPPLEKTRSSSRNIFRNPLNISRPSSPWSDKPVVESPETEEDPSRLPSEAPSPASEKFRSSPKSRAWTSLSPGSRSGSPSRAEPIPPLSPSKARWEHLRQHVLPASPTSPAPTVPAPSTLVSSPPHAAAAPARTQTPKPSRFARLGFRQVVEHVREAAVVDHSHQFAGEILKACWQSRFVEPTKGTRQEANLNTLASSTYLPFLASANASSVTVHQAQQQRKQELRRPQSIQSLAMGGRQVPSVKYIHAVLLHYATPNANQPAVASMLPHETQMLSALLAPFTTRTSGSRADEERWFSVESFEIAVKTWKPATHQVGVDRCLWCCKAAAMAPDALRMRILTSLSSLLLSQEDRAVQITTPGALLNLTQGLFSLLSSLAFLSAKSADVKLVKELIAKVQAAECGDLIPQALEREYKFGPSEDDEMLSVTHALVLTGIGKFLEHGAESSRRWVLRYSIEDYWNEPQVSFTPLLTAIHSRKIGIFSRGILNLLTSKSGDPRTARLDADIALRLLRNRMLPEAQAISGPDAAGARAHLIRVVLELLCAEDSKEITNWASSTVVSWYREGAEWKLSFDKRVEQLILENDWPTTLKILSALMRSLPDDVRKLAVASIIPSLNDQLVAEPPAHPCLPLTDLLDKMSQMYPQLFYKPLFACAASAKELTVQNYLSTLTVISRFLPDFWTRDPEMVSVALMSESANKTQGGVPTQGKARLGQSALLVELIGRVQVLRKADILSSPSDPVHAATAKFFTVLEARLGVLLDAKEKTTLVPLSQRMLFCVLFLEIRMLTRSLKPASWLPCIITWLQYSDNRGLDVDRMDDEAQAELVASVERLETLYTAVQNSFRESHKRHSTMLLLLTPDSNGPAGTERNADIIETFHFKTTFLVTLRVGFIPKILHLLVALYGMLSQDEYRRMGPFLWNRCLNDAEPVAMAFACFLIMQCAEKTPEDFLKIVEKDIHCSDSDARLQAIRRISTLFNWRFQLLSQDVVTDRVHRRPFKLTRGPLPFIATDIGSSLFVLEEDANQSKDTLPLELRKRLAEIGWAEDDEVVDQKQEWTRTPMSLLPSNELDLLENGSQMQASPMTPIASPAASPMKAPASPGNGSDLLRRKSSSGNQSHGVKRRAAFIPSLSAIFPQLATLVYDSNFAVATSARDAILDLMRNDPALLARPVFDLIADGRENFAAAITSFRAFEHVRPVLPPAMAHHVFNQLAGFLKYVAKHHNDNPDALGGFANTVSTLARIVMQVSDMSIREIRRAKVEIFLVPSGSLWFPSSAPPGAMFPRMFESYDNPFETAPSHLVDITMIRLSQNMLFLSMLKRNPQDVQLIRKNMARLVLPSRDNQVDAKPLKLLDFLPHKLGTQQGVSTSRDASLTGLSLMISRSYLLLVAQIFRSMSRHLNDRNELAVLIDGMNRILLVHGDDIGIVSQALIALMAASTRFRRLFTSGGGYTLFMPALVKIYAECESHSGIKLAIEYVVNRFYALHQEAFVFQSLDIIAHVMMAPGIEEKWVASSVYTLFSTLRRGVAPTTPDAAGIHDSNKLQEREALMVRTAEDKPQTFLASLRRGGSQGADTVVVDLPEEYEAKRLALDNFVRLFLTVIAHDPTILRAQHFLRFLRVLTPHLYNASNSARSVLRDGIDALGTVLTKAAAKAKIPESALLSSLDDLGFEMDSHEAVLENQLLGKSKTPSDIGVMRLDYLSMIVAFTTAGGQLPSTASQRILDLIKSMLKDSTNESKGHIALFFSDYTRTSLVRESAPSLKEVVVFLGHLVPFISAYATVVDFSGVFDTITQLAGDPLYANEPTFSRVVSNQICAAGLDACELAASEKLLLSLPCRTSTIRLVSAAIFLRGGDVMAELEKHHASYELLVGVVLPLVMSLKTTADIISDGRWADPWRRDVHARTWTRLLTYVMTACQKKQSARDTSPGPERSRSQTNDKRSSIPSSKAQMMTLVAAIQIIKAIVVRAEDDLSACLPGIWSRIASFLKSILADGDATFALTSQDYSVPPSPVPTPRGSTTFPNTLPSVFGDISAHVPLAKPRVIDYCMWSMFELLCLCRTPLVIQMRLFLQEKVVILDQELRYHQSCGRPRSRRLSSGMFSKPRRRMSGYLSGAPSPENSPILGASPSFPSDPSLFHLDPARQPGYERFASSPGGSPISGPRIVHLGPVHASSASAFRRSLSPIGGVRLNKTATIKSVSLALATYKRIRLVQTSLGYDSLLPMPNIGSDEIEEDPGNTRAWSKKQAMNALVKEMRELMVEFEEPWREVEDDVVLIDADQSVTF